MSHFADDQVFDTWFRIDARPFKQALLNIVKKWSFMFKQHLIDHVTNRCASQTGARHKQVRVELCYFIVYIFVPLHTCA